MTERGAAQVTRSASSLSIGSSSISSDGNSVQVDIDEICAPIPRRLRGSIRVTPAFWNERSFDLDDQALHRWTPHAPSARVEVSMREPHSSWSGRGYLDCNDGDVPLEDTFREWTWSRASLPSRTLLLYDTAPRTGAPRNLALDFSGNGRIEPFEAPPAVELEMTRWRMRRPTRGAAGHATRIVRTLEDAPFYSRSVLDMQLFGERAPVMHESLSLDRFRSPWVQCLLPFRMPRITF